MSSWSSRKVTRLGCWGWPPWSASFRAFWAGAWTYLGTTAASAPVVGTQPWTPVRAQALAPPGATYVRVELRLQGGGTLWGDDVEVTAR